MDNRMIYSDEPGTFVVGLKVARMARRRASLMRRQWAGYGRDGEPEGRHNGR